MNFWMNRPGVCQGEHRNAESSTNQYPRQKCVEQHAVQEHERNIVRAEKDHQARVKQIGAILRHRHQQQHRERQNKRGLHARKSKGIGFAQFIPSGKTRQRFRRGKNGETTELCNSQLTAQKELQPMRWLLLQRGPGRPFRHPWLRVVTHLAAQMLVVNKMGPDSGRQCPGLFS